MCTISWLTTRDGLHVRFNRDESIRRALATPPTLHHEEQLPFLAPTDPEGGGTWLAVTADGTVHALLNHYSIDAPIHRTPLSRGVVPYRLASGQWLIAQLLADPDPLQNIRPFHLIILSLETASCYTWDGEHLKHIPLNRDCGCITTSSLDPQNVTQFRLAAFARVMASENPPHPALLDRFHDGTETSGDPAASVLMDRDSRRTVSQSRIHIGNSRIAFEERLRDPHDTGFQTESHLAELPRAIHR